MPYRDLAKQKKAQHEWYLKNKEKTQQATKATRVRIREFVRSLRESPCTDCKKEFPWYVMEFDHCRGKKTLEISSLLWRCSREKLEEEIAKCDIVCANCHRIRTHLRR